MAGSMRVSLYCPYETLLKENPDYPDGLKVYQAMLPLARRLNNAPEITRCEREIKRLTLAVAPPKK